MRDSPEGETTNADENKLRIPTAPLLMGLRPDRVRRVNSHDGSMAGFRLPEAGHLQGADLTAAGVAKVSQGQAMEYEVKVGTVLVKDGTLLPEGLRLEAGPDVPGWKFVMDLDGYELDRAIRKTGWAFFCLVGDVKATVFGIDNQGMLRRAIERVLVGGKSNGFNSLEITQIASVGSERFPLVRYVTVSAKWRHIQESLFLGRGKDLPGLNRESVSGSQSTRIGSDKLESVIVRRR